MGACFGFKSLGTFMMLAGERDDDVFTELCCVSSGVAVY